MYIWNFIAMLAMVTMITSAENWKTVKRHRGWYVSLVDGFINRWTESTVPDRILCEWRCFNRLFCYGVTYSSEDSSCIIYNDGAILVHNGDMKNEITIFQQQNVTQVRDLTVPLGDWTVAAANNICEQVDLQLMTYNELNQARGDYYSSQCGYVEEGPISPQTAGMMVCTLVQAQSFCREPKTDITTNIMTIG